MRSLGSGVRSRGSLWAVGAAVVVTPVLFSAVDALKEAVLGFLGAAVEGVTGVAGWFAISTIEVMLFFPGPSQFDALTSLYWGFSFPLFWGILSVTGAGFFGMMQLFPESENADVDRFMKRVLFAVILLIVVGFGAIDYLVEAVNLVAGHLYPDQYRIAVGMDTMEGMATVGLTGVSVALFAILASPKILLTYGFFLTMIGMRMVLVYSMYALFPILIAFWIVDIGPMKYGKMMAGLMMKATVLLLLFGILIAAILGVGGGLAGNADLSEYEGSDIDQDQIQSDLTSESMSDAENSRTEGGVYTDGGGPQLSGEGQSALTSAWVSVFTYFASLWLCISITSLLLGGSISTGFSKQLIRGKATMQTMRKVRSRISERRGGGGAASGGGGSLMNSMTIGDNDGGGGDSGMANDAAPEPETPGDGGGLGDRIGGAVDDASEYASNASDSFSEGVDRMSEEGGVPGKVAAAGVKAPMKAGNLAKRGSKSYWSVFRQPDAKSSIGEMGRIARESPIGKPSSPHGSETGPAGVSSADMSDVDAGSESDEDDGLDEAEGTVADWDTSDTDVDTGEPIDDDEPFASDWGEESTGGDSAGGGDGLAAESGSGSGSPDDPVDSLYAVDNPSDRDVGSPKVNEDAAESIAEDIHESFDQPNERTIRDEVHNRVDQDLGDAVQAAGAEHAVMNKYRDVSGRDDIRAAASDYEWT